MPKRDDAYMAARRREILEATMRCLTRQGLSRTSTTDICKEGGLSMGALYTHFKSRNEIIRALLEETRERRHTHIAFDSYDDMFRNQVARFLSVLAPESAIIVKLDLQMASEAYDVEGLREAISDTYAETCARFERSFAGLPSLAAGMTPIRAVKLVNDTLFGLEMRVNLGSVGDPVEEVARLIWLLESITGATAPADIALKGL